MADFLSGFGIPDIDGKDPAESLNKIRDYLYQLQERLCYMTNNLGVGNFNDAELNNLTTTIRSPLKVQIEATDGRVAALNVTADGLSTRVGDAEGNISELTRRADGFDSWVVDVEGNMTDLQQSATELAIDIGHAGARNLFRNTGFNSPNGFLQFWTAYNAAVETMAVAEAQSGRGVKIKAATEGSGMYYISDIATKLTPGKHYVVSFYAKSDGTTKIQSRRENSGAVSLFDLSAAWKRYTYFFTQSANTSQAMIFYRVSGDDTFYLHSIKVEERELPAGVAPAEKNMMPSVWIYAPEDENAILYDSVFFRFRSDGFHVYNGAICVWEGTPAIPGDPIFYVDSSGKLAIEKSAIDIIATNLRITSYSRMMFHSEHGIGFTEDTRDIRFMDGGTIFAQEGDLGLYANGDINLGAEGNIRLKGGVEFDPGSASAGHGGYIDFHYNQGRGDFTSRIIEGPQGVLLAHAGAPQRFIVTGSTVQRIRLQMMGNHLEVVDDVTGVGKRLNWD